MIINIVFIVVVVVVVDVVCEKPLSKSSHKLSTTGCIRCLMQTIR